ncbi:MAG: hypothetical protein H6835_05650 [Planctomycetes bacterium]|nr:hypothetical protein [Planctomycetota bacterium]
MTPRTAALLLGAVSTLGACAAAPEWQRQLLPALSAARDDGRELVVYFALPGRDASDRMQASLTDPRVLDALGDGGFDAVIADATAENVRRLYGEWVGFGEGMGVAVVDAAGRCYATRPGPQDPPELAAWLRKCAASRAALAALRAKAGDAEARPRDLHAFGALLLELGCRNVAEPLLTEAALGGAVEACHELARSFALGGNVTQARRWLKPAPDTPRKLVTEGYVLFKERRHGDAVKVLERALQQPAQLGADRQRALLFLGKALHEERRDDEARRVLEGLIAEGTDSTFEAAARHTLGHMLDPSQEDHTH